MTATVHASAVRVGGTGVLIRGASGSGKSSLVLALLDRDPDSTILIADDRVALAAEGGRLIARAPAAIAGKLEVRGQGIFDYPSVSPAAIGLVVDLLPMAECPRMPEVAEQQATICGVAVPRLMLPIGATDGAVRLRAAIRHFGVAAGKSAKPLALRNRSVKIAPFSRAGARGRGEASGRRRQTGKARERE